MQIVRFKYAAICKTCSNVNYPVETFARLEDGVFFDPYELVENFTSNCIMCENESTMSLKFIQFEKRIFDMTRFPLKGEMSLYARKEEGLISNIDFSSSFGEYSPYDQYNAITVMELYSDWRNRQLNGTAKISPNEKHPREIYRANEFGSFQYHVLFKTVTPYVKMKSEQAYGFSIQEVQNVLVDIKNQLLNVMKQNKLPTFSLENDSPNELLL